jgi:hypothetical protein
MIQTAKEKLLDSMCQEYIRGYKDGWYKSHKETSCSYAALLDKAVEHKVITNEQADGLCKLTQLMRDEGDM